MEYHGGMLDTQYLYIFVIKMCTYIIRYHCLLYLLAADRDLAAVS